MKITKEWLRKNNACSSGVKWFLSQKETDAGKIMLKLIDENIGADALWVMHKCIKTKKQAVLIAIFAAESKIDIFEKKYPEDKRPRKAIEAARAWLENPCSKTKKDAYSAYSAYSAAASAAYYAADAYAYYGAAAYAHYASDAFAAASASAAYAHYAAFAAASASAAAAYTYYAAAAAADADSDSDDKEETQIKIVNYAIKILKL